MQTAVARAQWATEKPLGRLKTEAVKPAALALESTDNVKSGDSLPAGVLSVGHGIADHVLQENLQQTASLLVNEATDALHTSAACQATDSGLGDALDVVAKDLPVALRAAFAKTMHD